MGKWLVFLLFAVAATYASAACDGIGAPRSSGAPAVAPQGESSWPDRSDCAQIYGTAYRSPNERDWFVANCSGWPAFTAADGPAAPAAAPAPQNAATQQECARLRGRPYDSAEQRQWYLTNCQGQPAAAAPQAAQGGGNAPAAGDRTDCNQIRGTAYRSGTERDFYIQNCSGQQTTGAPSITVGPPIVIVPR